MSLSWTFMLSSAIFEVSLSLSELQTPWGVRTFEELAAVGLARGDFEGNDVALQERKHWLVRVQTGGGRFEIGYVPGPR